jgi:hypothetical protein
MTLTTGEKIMACMEHECMSCGAFWMNNKAWDVCECGSTNVRSLFDEHPWAEEDEDDDYELEGEPDWEEEEGEDYTSDDED